MSNENTYFVWILLVDGDDWRNKPSHLTAPDDNRKTLCGMKRRKTVALATKANARCVECERLFNALTVTA